MRLITVAAIAAFTMSVGVAEAANTFTYNFAEDLHYSWSDPLGASIGGYSGIHATSVSDSGDYRTDPTAANPGGVSVKAFYLPEYVTAGAWAVYKQDGVTLSDIVVFTNINDSYISDPGISVLKGTITGAYADTLLYYSADDAEETPAAGIPAAYITTPPTNSVNEDANGHFTITDGTGTFNGVSSMALFGSGLIGLVVASRKRKA